jgi:hypothetical protein
MKLNSETKYSNKKSVTLRTLFVILQLIYVTFTFLFLFAHSVTSYILSDKSARAHLYWGVGRLMNTMEGNIPQILQSYDSASDIG